VGIELFERAASGGGQLLRAELSSLGGSAQHVSVLLLTFDVGLVMVGVEPRTGSLRVEALMTAEDAPEGLQDAAEDEPWWRLLGSRLTRAWPAGDDPDGALCLQFGADDASPRFVSLEPMGAGLAIKLELTQ
jgi:hypothetical protein